MEFEDRSKKVAEEYAEDSESGESSEDVGESPKSVVGEWRMNKIGVVHSQVLKIREEDSHLGEDIVVSYKDNFINAGTGRNAQIRIVPPAPAGMMLASRLILPSSPLSGKSTLKAPSEKQFNCSV